MRSPGRLLLLLLLLSMSVVLLSPGAGLLHGDTLDAPDTPQVRLAHREILKKYGFQEKWGERKASARQDQGSTKKEIVKSEEEQEERSFFEFLESLSGLEIIIVIVIIILVAAIFYIIFRGGSGTLRRSVKPIGPVVRSGGFPDVPESYGSSHDPGYDSALRLADKGEFGKASIALHVSSVKKLQGLVLVPGGYHFTNVELNRLIRKSRESLCSPFMTLASAAERAAFKKDCTPEENRASFMVSKLVYESSFLNMEERV